MPVTESQHIVCPDCSAVNRIPAARIAEGPKCGKCRKSLFSARPLELTGEEFPEAYRSQ